MWLKSLWSGSVRLTQLGDRSVNADAALAALDAVVSDSDVWATTRTDDRLELNAIVPWWHPKMAFAPTRTRTHAMIASARLRVVEAANGVGVQYDFTPSFVPLCLYSLWFATGLGMVAWFAVGALAYPAPPPKLGWFVLGAAPIAIAAVCAATRGSFERVLVKALDRPAGPSPERWLPFV